MRQGLVIAQFALSIGLIIASLIVFRQMNFVQQANLGFAEDQLIVVDINDGGVRRDFRAIVSEYLSLSDVISVSVSSNIPGDWKSITQIDVRSTEGAGEDVIGSHFLAGDRPRHFNRLPWIIRAHSIHRGSPNKRDWRQKSAGLQRGWDRQIVDA